MPPPRYHDVGGFLPTCTAQAGYIPARYSPNTLFATWGISFLGARVNLGASQWRSARFTGSVDENAIHPARDQCACQALHLAGFVRQRLLLTSFTGLVWHIESCRMFLSLGPLNIAADSPLASARAQMQDVLKVLLLKSATQIWVCVNMITRK